VRPGKSNHESGVILIVVLWILVILIIFAAGMGRRGQVHTALAKYAAGQVRAKYVALSGVQYAIGLILKDKQDEESSGFDTLHQCGFALGKSSTVAQLFQSVPVTGGRFDIITSWQRKDGAVIYGLSDEDGRLNLNAVTGTNYQIFKSLLEEFDVSEETAETIAASVVDWVDADENIFNEPYGNEQREIDAQHPPVKNFAFQNLKELLFVKGMTPEIFAAIRDYVTVFPSAGSMTVNLDTASPVILRSLARSFTGAQTNTEIPDADALVRKIVAYRAGPDGIEGNSDDNVIDQVELNLNTREIAIMQQMESYRAKISEFLRFGVTVFKAEVIVSRAGKIMYWRRM
jgi:type II secretory pathway component PulK